jgi:transposase
MSKLPRQIFTAEFRAQAVKLVLEEHLTFPEAAQRLGMSEKTLANWVYRARAGKLDQVGDSRQPATAEQAEISRLKRELAEARLERDLLKKAAAYFASESVRGTRS